MNKKVTIDLQHSADGYVVDIGSSLLENSGKWAADVLSARTGTGRDGFK